jgi:hypothetical protein
MWYRMNLSSITLSSTPIACKHVYLKLQIYVVNLTNKLQSKLMIARKTTTMIMN